METGPVEIPNAALVVLAGPSGSGKSTWAATRFRADQLVSSDALRALVGTGEHDQRAGGDALDVLDLVIERRLARGLVTVVDSLGLDAERRGRWLAVARRHRRPTVAVAFDVPAAACRARNRGRDRPVPSKVLTGQLARWPAERERLDAEFDVVLAPGEVRIVPVALLGGAAARARHREDHLAMRFGLQVSSFTTADGPAGITPRLAAIAAEAEAAGFSSLWVMDHLLQIPQVGREWEPMLDAYTTLGWLAAITERVRIGTLVTAVTSHHLARLGKLVATLDVLSGGRACCGLGVGWFAREHAVYGAELAPLSHRYDLLADALELLPLLWGPGSPRFEGRTVTVPEAICYPRPLQERIPLLVGGSGERRTLRLVARHADACNVLGEPDVVARKVAVLARHCREVGRDPAEITVTQLSPVLCAADAAELAHRVDELRPASSTPEAFAEAVRAGTVDDHIGRFRRLAEAGVQEVIVSPLDLARPGSVAGFAPVIAAFAPGAATPGGG